MTDTLDFDHALSICIDRLRADDTLEACLVSYPSHVQRLAPLLRLAATMQVSAVPAMSADALRAGEARLLARAAELRSRQGQSLPARRAGVSRLLGTLPRLIVATVALILVSCALLSAGTVSASSASLPGSPLYPVKRISESLVSSLALTPQLQTRVHLAWADRRLREIETLVARDGVAHDTLVLALEQETQHALVAAEQAGRASLASAVTHTQHQQAVLSRLLDQAPQAARPGLERALAASAQSHARARSALKKAEGRGPPMTPPGQASPGPPGAPPGQGGAKPAHKKIPTMEAVDELQIPGRVSPPDDTGPPDHTGPPDDIGPPDHAGPPSDTGPPDHPRPPGGTGGPPDHANQPDDAGPPDDKGSGRGGGTGGGKEK